jgi:hypothetical protein
LRCRPAWWTPHPGGYGEGRGLAAHGEAKDLRTEKELDYLALIDAVLFAIRRGARQP